MPYFGKLSHEFSVLLEWMDVRKEQGADLREIESAIAQFVKATARQVVRMPDPSKLNEPDTLAAIKLARPKTRKAPAYGLSDDHLYDKMLGAWLGRSAGCILGVPVEGKSRYWIEAWARKLGQPYPLADYFKDYCSVPGTHYSEPDGTFVKPIDHIGPDDDLAYTVLGLLILEQYGIDFAPEDVGEAWVKYLPLACTAEHAALENLKAGLKPPRTALKNNPYCEWIGADIRSDPWGYAAPGLPEVAAEFAWRDASISHVRNGIYGEMFFSAAIAAAFVCDSVEQVLDYGLAEIPAQSRMAKTVRQTIKWVKTDGDWSTTWDRVAKQYAGMSVVHTLNNAALTIMALLYGEGDFEKTISLAVMGGLDTDCTGATAGSIAGAMLGARRLPKKWTKPLGDRLTTYLKGEEEHSVTDLARRCCSVAAKVRQRYVGG